MNHTNEQLVLNTLLEVKEALGSLTSEVKANNKTVVSVVQTQGQMESRLQTVETQFKRVKWTVSLGIGAVAFVGWVLNYLKP